MNLTSYFLIAVLVFLIYLLLKIRSNNNSGAPKLNQRKTTKPSKRVAAKPLSKRDTINNAVTTPVTQKRKDYLLNAQDFINQQRYEDAIKELKTGLSLQSNNSQMILKLLNVYALTNNIDKFNLLFSQIETRVDSNTLQQAKNLKTLLEEEVHSQEFPLSNTNESTQSSTTPIPSSFDSNFNASQATSSTINQTDKLAEEPSFAFSTEESGSGFSTTEKPETSNSLDFDFKNSTSSDSKDETLFNETSINDATFDDSSFDDLENQFLADDNLTDNNLDHIEKTSAEQDVTDTSTENTEEKIETKAAADYEKTNTDANTNAEIEINTAPVAVELAKDVNLSGEPVTAPVDLSDSTSFNAETASDNAVNQTDVSNLDFSLDFNDTSLNNAGKTHDGNKEIESSEIPYSDTEDSELETAEAAPEIEQNTIEDEATTEATTDEINPAAQPVITDSDADGGDTAESNEETADVETIDDDTFDQTFDFVQDLDNAQITLDLAQQYLDLGEYDSAKRLIDEVMQNEATEEQKLAAKDFLERMS